MVHERGIRLRNSMSDQQNLVNCTFKTNIYIFIYLKKKKKFIFVFCSFDCCCFLGGGYLFSVEKNKFEAESGLFPLLTCVVAAHSARFLSFRTRIIETITNSSFGAQTFLHNKTSFSYHTLLTHIII